MIRLEREWMPLNLFRGRPLTARQPNRRFVSLYQWIDLNVSSPLDMSTATSSIDATALGRHAPTPRGARWVAKRALIGIALLFAFAFGGAMLYDASIDANAEDAPATHSEE